MKIKWTWALFVPFFLAVVGLKIYRTLFLPDGAPLFGLNSTQLTYLSVLLTVGMFLLCALINITDKKTADILPPARSIVTGLLTILLSGIIMTYSLLDIYGMFVISTYVILWMISDVLGVLSAIVLIFVAVGMFTGKRNYKGFSLFFLIPSMWSAVQLIATFAEFTRLSVRNTDMTIIVAYVFQTMFILCQAAVLISYSDKGVVKRTFVYGLPAIVLLSACSVSAIVNLITDPLSFSLEEILLIAQIVVMALFILSFLASATVHLARRDDIIKTTEQEYYDPDEPTEEEQDSYRRVAEQLEEEENQPEVLPDVEDEPKPSPNGDSAFSEASDILDKLLEDL